jgi:hypothetical protein
MCFSNLKQQQLNNINNNTQTLNTLIDLSNEETKETNNSNNNNTSQNKRDIATSSNMTQTKEKWNESNNTALSEFRGKKRKRYSFEFKVDCNQKF